MGPPQSHGAPLLWLLLHFSCCPSPVVRERALGRIVALTQLLEHHHTLRNLRPTCRSPFSPIPPEELPAPLLGQLLGYLLLFCFAKDGTSSLALDALCGLHQYLLRQEERPKPEHKLGELRWDEETSPQDLTMRFAGSLYPRERTDIVCVVIEAMKDSSIFDRRVAEDILELVMSDLNFWLAEMPSVVKSIRECLRNSSREATGCRMDALLVLMAIKRPRALTISMVLNVPLRDSTDVGMWEMVLTVSKTSEALRELLRMLQDTRDTSIHSLVTMASGAGGAEGAEEPQSLSTVSVLLECLSKLSENPDLARKLQRLLPHIMGSIRDASEELRIKALMILWNVMGHLPRAEASSIAVGLVRDLRPLFDGGCSQLRELSIRLFRFLLELVLGCDRWRVRSKTWDLLLPLFFRMSDQSHSVAEASREALLAAATLLGWEELQRLLERRQMWRVAECLVERSRKRIQGYLYQSLQYLQDAQVPLQEAAIRFIGEPLRSPSRSPLLHP
ncbi:uncharacterized protein LOC136006784 [Lathamus discolor]|uniref:uncharacterized protein LOC136006784 n=1 Tax=Lathamus discolor TaxID=678569 RepID=UPI0032B712AE